MILKGKKPTVNTDTNKDGLLERLKTGLSRTGAGFGHLFLGEKKIDADFLQRLEDCLLTADVGIETSENILEQLSKEIPRSASDDQASLLTILQKKMQTLLQPCEQPLNIDDDKKPFIILVVGVNGAGKTTTIGKLAQRLKNEGKRVMLAAGDTFRAAAVEQLQAWGKRHDIDVIAQASGNDSAAVIFDAINAAKARNADVLIADTAGRLHTQTNLMTELQKVVRIIHKADASAPHETLLVLDANSGQNALQQVKQFQQVSKVSGIVLTKLDGTAKGGIIFAVAAQTQLPLRFIGIGERTEDLQVFNATTFVSALFDNIHVDQV